MSSSHRSLLLAILTASVLSSAAFGQFTEGPLSGSSSSNVILSGSSASWSNTGNALSSDNSYASSTLSSNGDFTDYLVVTNFGFNISLLNTILGIEVELEKFGDKVKDNRVRIVKSGSIRTTDRSDNANWSNNDTDSYTLYGGNNDLWGEVWTPLNINSADFGIAISAGRADGGGGAAVPNIDHIRITVYFETPLPVNLTYFSAWAEGQEARLQWETDWEEGNSHFEVQRSSNAFQFETIGFVPGANHSSDLIAYHFVDDTPGPGQNYYRLKQHDFNGSFAFSEVVRVMVETHLPEYRFTSNLLTSSTTFIINDPSPEAYTLQIIDQCGRVIRKIRPSSRETEIHRSSLRESGIYFYRLTREKALKGSGKFWAR